MEIKGSMKLKKQLQDIRNCSEEWKLCENNDTMNLVLEARANILYAIKKLDSIDKILSNQKKNMEEI